MPFIFYLYSGSMKTFTLVESIHLETSEMFGKIIWLSEFLVSGSRYEEATLTTLFPSFTWLNIKILCIMNRG